MPVFLRWALGVSIAGLLTGVPFLYYRWEYTHHKRLREVAAGRVYRSGQMTAPGFEEAVRRLGIRTIINLQDEYPDPDVAAAGRTNWATYWATYYFTGQTIKETELCRALGVNYIHLTPDMVSRYRLGVDQPRAIGRFLAIMDDSRNYPVLLHCRAGLHRTGVMTAVYRMEYQGWSPRQAIAELKENGFGEFACSSANDYVAQYILAYRPRTGDRRQGTEVRDQRSEIRNQRSEIRNQKTHCLTSDL